MSATISKRSQARNERAIQELIRTVPGNDRCADCQARNPGRSCNAPNIRIQLTASLLLGWASWSVSRSLRSLKGVLEFRRACPFTKAIVQQASSGVRGQIQVYAELTRWRVYS